MKKLKLSLGNNILSKEQMKSIVGGYGDCVVTCPDGHKITCHYESGFCATGTNGTSCYSFEGGVLDIRTCSGS